MGPILPWCAYIFWHGVLQIKGPYHEFICLEYEPSKLFFVCLFIYLLIYIPSATHSWSLVTETFPHPFSPLLLRAQGFLWVYLYPVPTSLCSLRPDKTALLGNRYHTEGTALGRASAPVVGGGPTWRLSCASATHILGASFHPMCALLLVNESLRTPRGPG